MFKLRKDHKVVVLSGAGISAESGIRTFRDCNGLWENFSVEKVATPEGFKADPEKVWQFYNDRIKQLGQVEPNAAHRALTELENFLGNNMLLVTQNVDDLHERAGTDNLLHMHGALLSIRCCGCCYKARSLAQKESLPLCPECGSLLRPDIVWFGEMPFYMPRIEKALMECDLFIAVGTSNAVYPAAGFMAVAKRCGAYTMAVNPDPGASGGADEFLMGKAGNVLPELICCWTKER